MRRVHCEPRPWMGCRVLALCIVLLLSILELAAADARLESSFKSKSLASTIDLSTMFPEGDGPPEGPDLDALLQEIASWREADHPTSSGAPIGAVPNLNISATEDLIMAYSNAVRIMGRMGS